MNWRNARIEAQTDNLTRLLESVFQDRGIAMLWMTTRNAKLGWRTPLVMIAQGDVVPVMNILHDIERSRESKAPGRVSLT